MKSRYTYISFTILMLCLIAATAHAATITIVPPVGIERAPEIVVVEWASAKKGEVLTRVNPPESVTLQAGDYGLRIVGTDYTYGPVRVKRKARFVLELSEITMTAPPSAAYTFFFLIDKKTGAVAARIQTNNVAVVTLPGTFNLKRDMAEEALEQTIQQGESVMHSCGALVLKAPETISDCNLFIVDAQSDRVQSYFKYSQGAQALLPGQYKMIREHSGSISSNFTISEGNTTVFVCSAVGVSSLGDKGIPYVIFTHPELRPVFKGTSDTELQLIFPGTYGGMSVKKLKEYDASTYEDALRSSLAFTSTAGEQTSLWITKEYTFFSSGNSAIPVTVEALSGGMFDITRPYNVTVEVAEQSHVTLFVTSTNTNDRLAQIATFEAFPPYHTASVTLPDTIYDGSFVFIEASVTAPSGDTFTGSTAPFIAVRSQAGAVKALSMKAISATTVDLKWKKANGKDIAGYRIYRVKGKRPIHGKQLLQKRKFKDIGLSAGKVYAYEVCAVDSRGIEGSRSEILTVETKQK